MECSKADTVTVNVSRSWVCTPGERTVSGPPPSSNHPGRSATVTSNGWRVVWRRVASQALAWKGAATSPHGFFKHWKDSDGQKKKRRTHD